MALFGHFAWMMKFVFFFAWKEAWFASARWQWLLRIEVTWESWQCMEFATTWQFLQLGTLLRRSWRNLLTKFVGVKCWLVAQQRCKYVILAPLYYCNVSSCISWHLKNQIANVAQNSKPPRRPRNLFQSIARIRFCRKKSAILIGLSSVSRRKLEFFTNTFLLLTKFTPFIFKIYLY